MRTRLGLVVALVATAAVVGVLLRGDRSPSVGAQTPPDGTPTPVVAAPPERPTTVLPPPSPVRLDREAVTLDVNGLVAITTTDLYFRNPTDRPQEATLLFPIPPGVAISDFTMTVDGNTLEGEILGRDEAARIYTGIVQRQKDPALLEYVGSDVLRARVFPVPPRGESRLTLRYAQLLRPENGTLRYRLPLSAGADAGPTLTSLTISARVRQDGGMGSLFSPTQSMRVNRVDANVMTASYEGTNVPLRGMFELNMLPSGGAVPAGMIDYHTPGTDGFFTLWLAPPLRQESVVDKDVILVLDVSGSMAGRKIDQAKAALRFVLNRLNPGDRFNIVTFSSSVDRLSATMRPAAEVNDGIAYVDRLRAEGGTNINDALQTALRFVDRERPTTLIFLTDGLPTVGEQNRNRILDNVTSANTAGARLFVFGVGDDVDTTLLDTLGSQNRGDVQYVPPAEDVEEKVSTLYARISSPQLTDVRLDFGNADVYDIYPQPLPDLFGGQTLFVLGRYRSSGPVNVRMTGTTREGPQSFDFPQMQLSAEERGASWLPYLWASRKVGALLREIRLRGVGGSKELIDEVVALSTRYGIITPYTSFLVQEPTTLSPQAAATRVAAAAAAPVSGAGATSNAAQTGALAQATPAPRPAATALPFATATTAPGAPPPPPSQRPPAAEVLEQRFVGEKSFVLRNGVWTDSSYVAGTETVKVAFGSEAYFNLVTQRPEIAPYLALGERVIVVLDGSAYEVTAG